MPRLYSDPDLAKFLDLAKIDPSNPGEDFTESHDLNLGYLLIKARIDQTDLLDWWNDYRGEFPSGTLAGFVDWGVAHHLMAREPTPATGRVLASMKFLGALRRGARDTPTLSAEQCARFNAIYENDPAVKDYHFTFASDMPDDEGNRLPREPYSERVDAALSFLEAAQRSREDLVSVPRSTISSVQGYLKNLRDAEKPFRKDVKGFVKEREDRAAHPELETYFEELAALRSAVRSSEIPFLLLRQVNID